MFTFQPLFPCRLPFILSKYMCMRHLHCVFRTTNHFFWHCCLCPCIDQLLGMLENGLVCLLPSVHQHHALFDGFLIWHLRYSLNQVSKEIVNSSNMLGPDFEGHQLQWVLHLLSAREDQAHHLENVLCQIKLICSAMRNGTLIIL